MNQNEEPYVVNDFMYMYMVITVQVLGDMLYYKLNYNYNYNTVRINRKSTFVKM